MRRHFVKLIKEKMNEDEKIHLITADLGYGMFNDFDDLYKDRFHNVGAAEQLMVGCAIGLAQEGKIPLCYSITPFLLYRPFELIRNYLQHERCNVKLIGAGRDNDYSHDGISHWAHDDEDIIGRFFSIDIYKPRDNDELDGCFNKMLYSGAPSYLNLRR